MAVTLQAVPGTGLVINSDNSGSMSFSTGLGTGNVAMTIGSNSAVTFTGGNPVTSGTYVMSSAYTMRNKIINGAMVIDQRNGGNSVTPTSSGYTVDRWQFSLTAASKFSLQRNAGSITPPAGFRNYMGATSLSAYSMTGTDNFQFRQAIEGYNIADLAWGTASAKPVTLSFWVYSNQTGLFSGSLYNPTPRSYPFSFTISAANTWTYVSIAIPGDTTGTYPTDNTSSIYVIFCLGSVNTYLGTAGSWSGNVYIGVTGQVNLVSINGATFYITGVQFEAGSAPTPFELRPMQQELALCQRYYEKSYDLDTNPASATTNGMASGYYNATNGINQRFQIKFAVTKRAVPNMLGWDAAGNANKVTCWNSGNAQTNNLSTGSRSFVLIGMQSAALNEADLGAYYAIATHWTSECEL